jgi:hypothetical protein
MSTTARNKATAKTVIRNLKQQVKQRFGVDVLFDEYAFDMFTDAQIEVFLKQGLPMLNGLVARFDTDDIPKVNELNELLTFYFQIPVSFWKDGEELIGELALDHGY